MPDVPPIRTKIEVDTSSLDRAAARMELFGTEAERKLEPAGRAFVTFGDKGELASTRISSATAKTRADLDALEARTRQWAESTGSSFEKGTQAVLKLGSDGTASLEKLSTSMKAMGDSTQGATTKLIDFGAAGVQPMNALIGLGVALGAVLGPLLAYTVSLAGALALGGLVVGGMGILGAGVIALAEHYNNWAEAAKTVTTAQKAVQTATESNEAAVEALDKAQLAYDTRPTAMNLLNLQQAQEQAAESAQKLTDAQNKLTAATIAADNPWTRLMTNLNQMALTLGQQATPAAGKILDLFNSLIPKVEELGSRLITWFGGDRLSSGLGIVLSLFNNFMDTISKLGDRIGPIFDRLLFNSTTFQAAFQKTLGGAADAVVWLVQKLQDLSDWWGKNGPVLERTTKASFDIVVLAVQGTISILGSLILKLNDVETEIGNYANTLSGKLAPAQDQMTNRTRDQQRGLEGLKTALDAISQIIGVPIKFFADLALNVADLVGKVLNLTDRLAGLGGVANPLGPIFWGLVDVLKNLTLRGFEAAVPIWGLVNAFQAAYNAIDAALRKFREWQNRGPSGGGGGGGGGGDGAFFQHGGTLQPGHWGRVGEKASELLYAIPGGGALVVPEADDSRRGGGNITVNINAANLGQIDQRQLTSMLRRYVMLYG